MADESLKSRLIAEEVKEVIWLEIEVSACIARLVSDKVFVEMEFVTSIREVEIEAR